MRRLLLISVAYTFRLAIYYSELLSCLVYVN